LIYINESKQVCTDEEKWFIGLITASHKIKWRSNFALTAGFLMA